MPLYAGRRAIQYVPAIHCPLPPSAHSIPFREL